MPSLVGTKPEDGFVNCSLASVQVADEFADAALVVEALAAIVALVDQLDADAGVQERQLAQALRQDLVVELDVREDLVGRLEADGRAALVAVADHSQRRNGVTQAVFLLVPLAVAADGQVQGFGQSVDDRNADPVQATGNLVGRVVELTAGVQDGHDDLGCRTALLGWISTGMPRPLSVTVTDSSAWMVTVMWCSGRPAPRRSSCRRPRKPCGAGRCRHRCHRCTCRGVCAPRQGLLRP